MAWEVSTSFSGFFRRSKALGYCGRFVRPCMTPDTPDTPYDVAAWGVRTSGVSGKYILKFEKTVTKIQKEGDFQVLTKLFEDISNA